MLSTVFWVYSLLVFVISFALCIWLGYRRGAFNGAMRLGFFLLSGVIAFVIARLLVNPIGNSVSELVSLSVNFPSLQQLVVKLLGGLAAPLIFMVLFFIIDKLSLFAYVPLKKRFADNEKLHTVPYDKLFGALLGFVLAFCITLTCVMPIGYVSLADETIDAFDSTSMSDAILSADVAEPLDAAADTAIVKVDYAISGWLFRGLSTDARSVISTSFSLLSFFDDLQKAEDIESVSTALQNVPTESFDLLISLAQDTLAQIVPEDAPYRAIVDTLSKALDKLPAMRQEISPDQYAKEVEAITAITMMINDPSSVTDADIIKAALSSSILTNVILENSDVLAEELSDVTSELSKKEKKEIKNTVNEYADELDVDDEVVSSVLSIFGIS